MRPDVFAYGCLTAGIILTAWKLGEAHRLIQGLRDDIDFLRSRTETDVIRTDDRIGRLWARVKRLEKQTGHPAPYHMMSPDPVTRPPDDDDDDHTRN